MNNDFWYTFQQIYWIAYGYIRISYEMPGTVVHFFY